MSLIDFVDTELESGGNGVWGDYGYLSPGALPQNDETATEDWDGHALSPGSEGADAALDAKPAAAEPVSKSGPSAASQGQGQGQGQEQGQGAEPSAEPETTGDARGLVGTIVSVTAMQCVRSKINCLF